jgi:hypothetical protein
MPMRVSIGAACPWDFYSWDFICCFFLRSCIALVALSKRRMVQSEPSHNMTRPELPKAYSRESCDLQISDAEHQSSHWACSCAASGTGIRERRSKTWLFHCNQIPLATNKTTESNALLHLLLTLLRSASHQAPKDASSVGTLASHPKG